MTGLLTLHNPASAKTFYADSVWHQDTLYDLLEKNAGRYPDKPAVRDASRQFDWQELKRQVDILAASMAELGLYQGDRVSIWLPSCIETVIVFLACSRNGYVCNSSLHQNYTVSEITELLNTIGSKVLFAQPGFGADAMRASIFDEADSLPKLKRVYVVGDSTGEVVGAGERFHSFPGITDLNNSFTEPVSDPDKICYLAFTSGTTGKPKAVLHSDNTLLANVRPMVEDWGHDSNTRLLTLSPLSHHIAIVAINQVLVTGGELLISHVQGGQNTLDWILETGATYVMGVPTHAMDVLDEMSRRGLQHLGEVKTFYMAGAPIPVEVARAFLDMGVKPQNVYGMTENGSHQYTKPDDPVEVITGTVGKACRGYQVKLWDPENPDREVATGEVGEIGSKGGLLMLGYFDNQYATESSFNADGWFLSGDLGKLDPEGNLSIVGRKKDLIIRGGHNIFPSRIENLALTHPLVLKAAAFPVADDRLGERVCLAITVAGESPEAYDILEHLYEVGLSKYDMPEYYLVLETLPLTASGKILKRTLAEWVQTQKIIPDPVRWTGKRESRVK